MKKTYTIKKLTDKGETNYGKGYEDVYEVIPKDYKFNGLFYESKRTKNVIYTVTED
ncbi:MAG: hypothetical protein VZR95_10625 [Alphaproteobacteria bacterium]